MQDRSKVATVSIPVLHGSDICPVAALCGMLEFVPGSCDQPLFQFFTGSNLSPLTDSVARRHLKAACQKLQLEKLLTFHDFRRGGATWAFRRGVPIQDSQAQGTWSSECV